MISATPVRTPQQTNQRYYGCYRALVVDNKHPKKLGYLKLQVPEVFGNALVTDWACPKTGYLGAKYDPNGLEPESNGRTKYLTTPKPGGDQGDFFVPDIGTGVWVEFEAGDACRPIWSGRWFAEPEGKTEIPLLAQGVKDESQKSDPPSVFPKGNDWMQTATQTITQTTPGPVMESALEIKSEIPVSFQASYPNNRVLKTKRGIIVELDDTYDEATDESHVRIHIWHPTKSWVEWHPDGSFTEHVQTRRYAYVEVDDDLHIKGNYNITVEGDCTLRVGGKCTREVVGDDIVHIKGNKVEYIEGNREVHVKGNETIWIEGEEVRTLDKSQLETISTSILRIAGSSIKDQCGNIDHGL